MTRETLLCSILLSLSIGACSSKEEDSNTGSGATGGVGALQSGGDSSVAVVTGGRANAGGSTLQAGGATRTVTGGSRAVTATGGRAAGGGSAALTTGGKGNNGGSVSSAGGAGSGTVTCTCQCSCVIASCNKANSMTCPAGDSNCSTCTAACLQVCGNINSECGGVTLSSGACVNNP